MIKLNIFNMSEFLKTVNGCKGEVNIIYPDGRKENINKQITRQRELISRHTKNKHCLRLMLEVSEPKDYLNMVYFYICNC